jgi:PleD family two-component response regulator
MEGLLPVEWFPAHSIIAFSPSDDAPQPPHSSEEEKQKFPRKRRIGNRVLIVGLLRELAIYRAEFLRQAGFKVVTAVDSDEALPIVQHGRFDAIILSYTLPTHTVRYLANATRDYCPDCAIVTIAETSALDRHIDSDAVVIAEEGPAALVSALNRVLQLS